MATIVTFSEKNRFHFFLVLLGVQNRFSYFYRDLRINIAKFQNDLDATLSNTGLLT